MIIRLVPKSKRIEQARAIRIDFVEHLANIVCGRLFLLLFALLAAGYLSRGRGSLIPPPASLVTVQPVAVGQTGMAVTSRKIDRNNSLSGLAVRTVPLRERGTRPHRHRPISPQGASPRRTALACHPVVVA